MNARGSTARSGRPIASAILPDKTIVESIYSPERQKTSFLAWRNEELEERDVLEASHGRLVPYAPTNNLLSHRVILLPSGAQEYGGTASLVGGIRAFIHRYADLSEAFEEVAACYVLMSWIYDSFNELPYLRLKGDFGTGKSRCLQTIGSICYRPMMASGASTVSPLFRIIDAFRGTLIIDESDFRFSDEKADIIKILNNGNARGFPLLRCEVTPSKEFNPRAFDVYGPKVIATRGPFEDPALESRCFTEAMSGLPPRPEIPLNLPSEFHEEALQLRNQLLMYRFRTLHRDRGRLLDRDMRVDARMTQLLAPLLAVIEDPKVAARVRAVADRKTSEMLAEREASVEAQLLDIMCQMRSDDAPLMVNDIAVRFAAAYGDDFAWPITARWVGSQLRTRLGIVPMKRRGRFVVANEDLRLKALFERYGLGVKPS